MIVIAIVASFACLSLGILLIGIACVKEAFTRTITNRIEAGAVAVETTTHDTRSGSDRRTKLRFTRQGDVGPDRRRS